MTYQEMVHMMLIECYRTQTGVKMSKIIKAIGSPIDYSSFESTELQIKKALEKMV